MNAGGDAGPTPTWPSAPAPSAASSSSTSTPATAATQPGRPPRPPRPPPRRRHGPAGYGGRHFYFAHPGGLVRNDAGRRLGPGLDIRGDGATSSPHQAATPAAATTTRTAPTTASPTTRLAPGPPARPHRPPTTCPPTEICSPRRTSAWAQAALERELARVASAPEGARNSTLNKASFSLGQIIGGGALDSGDVEALLVDRAAGIGLGEREARATIASGLSAGARQPRGPAATTIDLRTVALPGTPTSAQ